MDGYEVIGSDDGKLGHVVEIDGDFLIARRAKIQQGESEAGVRGRPIIPPDPHDPL